MDPKERIARACLEEADRLLLAHLLDVLRRGEMRSIPTATEFLSAREQALARQLFPELELRFFGGYAGAERAVAVWLPPYLEEDWLLSDESPVAALHATFAARESLTHRDILGALMGCGIERSAVGDLLPGEGVCDLLVTRQIAPFVLQNLTSAGRVRLQMEEIALAALRPPEQKFQYQRETVASLRLDAVCAAAFRLSREKAAQAISAHRVSIGGLPCEKADRLLQQGDVLSLRGVGKADLFEVGGTTKKGRISLLIRRYL